MFKTLYWSCRSELGAIRIQAGQKYRNPASITYLQSMLAVHVSLIEKILITPDEPFSDLGPVRLPDRKTVVHRPYFARA